MIAEVYMGAPCKRGHSGERYVRSRTCVECSRAHARRRSRKRREELRGQQAEYRTTPRGKAVRIWNTFRRRAEEKNLEFSLTREWIEQRLVAGCELTGMEFVYSSGGGISPLSPSVDRIDNAAGYTPENCRIILWALNTAFNTWGEGVFREIALSWLGETEPETLIGLAKAA